MYMTDRSVIKREAGMGPKIIDKDEKRGAIVGAAAEIFARMGYRAATMEKISHEAGIAKGTTYLYFKSKQELFLAVFDWFVDWMLGEAESGLNQPGIGSVELLNTFLENSLKSLDQIRDLFPLYMEFWAAAAAGEQRAVFGVHMRRLYVKYRGAIERLIEKGIREGDFGEETEPDVVASVLVGAMDGLMVQAWLEPELDISRMGRVFMQTLIRGLAEK
jgi:AcrR family transcriptional regulator